MAYASTKAHPGGIRRGYGLNSRSISTRLKQHLPNEVLSQGRDVIAAVSNHTPSFVSGCSQAEIHMYRARKNLGIENHCGTDFYFRFEGGKVRKRALHPNERLLYLSFFFIPKKEEPELIYENGVWLPYDQENRGFHPTVAKKSQEIKPLIIDSEDREEAFALQPQMKRVIDEIIKEIDELKKVS
tara:strand:+ start:8489 stop:9043 length:555 start_codon:yes stop_codon:yes gene_type:complete